MDWPAKLLQKMGRTKDSKFHQFPQLPPELRLMIWERALLCPRIVHLVIRVSPCELNTLFLKSITPAPSLVHVNFESRAVAQRFYEFRFFGDTVTGFTYQRKPKIYFNYDIDTLFIDTSRKSIPPLHKFLLKSEIHKIKRIAAPARLKVYWQNTGAPRSWYPIQMMHFKLEELTLVETELLRYPKGLILLDKPELFTLCRKRERVLEYFRSKNHTLPTVALNVKYVKGEPKHIRKVLMATVSDYRHILIRMGVIFGVAILFYLATFVNEAILFHIAKSFAAIAFFIIKALFCIIALFYLIIVGGWAIIVGLGLLCTFILCSILCAIVFGWVYAMVKVFDILFWDGELDGWLYYFELAIFFSLVIFHALGNRLLD